MLEEILKRLTIDSTINNSTYYNSDKNDAEGNKNNAEGNPKSNLLVAAHSSNEKKEKSLILTLTMEILHKNY